VSTARKRSDGSRPTPVNRGGPRTSEELRLAASASAALLVHLLAFLALEGVPAKPAAQLGQRLAARLTPLSSGRVAPAEGDSSNIGRPEAIRSGRATRSAASDNARDGTGQRQIFEANDSGRSPIPSASELIGSARVVARETGRQQDGDRRRNEPGEDRPFLPELDRALRKTAPGEKRFAGGTIKITTPTGRVYCLPLPPEYARGGGMVEALSVPSTCP